MTRKELKLTITAVMILWCNIVYCSEIKSVFHYNSQTLSKYEYLINKTGIPSPQNTHTPMPTDLDIYVCNKSSRVCGSLPTGFKSTIEYSQSSSYFNSTAADSGERYTFMVTPVKVETVGQCNQENVNGQAVMKCTWPGRISLPLTLVDTQSGHEITRQNVTINIDPGGGNNDTDQYASITGEIELDETPESLSEIAVDTTALDNLRLEWTVEGMGDTDGDIYMIKGSLTLNGASGTTIHRSLTPESLNASFSAQSIEQNKTVTLSGPKESEPLSPIYIYHDNTPCDDSSLCAYSLNNATATIVCDDSNAHLAFNQTCNASATSLCQDGKVGDIQGTWGRVAIDTMCAITVTIPYE